MEANHEMTDEAALPGGSELAKQIRLLGLIVSLPGVAVVFAYVALLLDLETSDWVSLGAVVGIVGGAAGFAGDMWRTQAMKPIADWLDAHTTSETSHESTLNAFQAVIALPVGFQRMSISVWGIVAVTAPVVLGIIGGEAWGLGFGSFVVITAGLAAAMISASLLFFGVKRELEPVRVAIAARIPDASERRARIQPIPISKKLTGAMVGTVAALVVFSMLLTYSRTIRSQDIQALDWQLRAVAVLASILEQQDPEFGIGFDEAVASLVANAEMLPYPSHFELVDAGTAEDAADAGDTRRLEILQAVENGERSGSLGKSHQAMLWSWHELSDGRIAAASIRRDDMTSYAGEIGLLLGAILVVSIALAWIVAFAVSTDLASVISGLQNSAERMAGGDLQRGRIYESEDELGDLSRSFEAMGGALRTTVKSLAAAADRVDSAAGQIAEVADGVAGASADQVRRIQQASELMVSINSQVMEVSTSAQDLNTSVEESSSSILELGAAGDELNETASVLGSKVDEVSSSIEQMVRSVKQVGASSDGLSEAAAETSASMEEMASAMRAVDTTAEMTADLSRVVVASAETGQEKVSQTINGMQAISDATNSAEAVIRGLGTRTKEIGAILDVIDDVADETNLLALNAAIIAAQAGEHGRAFSVVADEIKELADRVLASTKEIGGLIRSVQDESTNAVGAIEDGSQSVASGVELSAEAGLSLEEITRSSRESGQHIGEIVSAVRDQTKAASHVVSLMDKVRDGVTQIGRASAEQDRGNEVVYRSSVTMREVAQQVRRTTEEQSRGFGRIRESVEGVREAVENINGSLQEQSSACGQVTDFLEQVYERTRSNEEAARSMGDAIRGMVGQAELLREDMAKFRV